MYIVKKAKAAGLKVYNLFRYYKLTSSGMDVPTGTKVAVINFGGFLLNTDMGRFAFILSQFVRFSGFVVVIKLDKKFFLRSVPYKKLLLEQDYTFVRHTGTAARTITLHGLSGVKLVSLDNGYRLLERRAQDAWYLPFTLHPRFYKRFLSKDSFAEYRNLRRKMRIFFAGNADKALYNNSVLKDNFKTILSRVEVLDHLKERYRDNEDVLSVYEKNALYELLKTNSVADKFVLSEARTPDEDWLSIMGKASFYLCLPGVRMPWSHNAFEAMCMGTIPIIQYGDLFSPPLTHLVNCLAYHTLEEFDLVVELALSMDEQQMAVMKKNVSLYYDQFVATEVVIDKLNSFFASDEEELKIAIPYLQKPLPVLVSA